MESKLGRQLVKFGEPRNRKAGFERSAKSGRQRILKATKKPDPQDPFEESARAARERFNNLSIGLKYSDSPIEVDLTIHEALNEFTAQQILDQASKNYENRGKGK